MYNKNKIFYIIKNTVLKINISYKLISSWKLKSKNNNKL